jgi:hypothetical protein
VKLLIEHTGMRLNRARRHLGPVELRIEGVVIFGPVELLIERGVILGLVKLVSKAPA